jgi:hypothetical protein
MFEVYVEWSFGGVSSKYFENIEKAEKFVCEMQDDMFYHSIRKAKKTDWIAKIKFEGENTITRRFDDKVHMQNFIESLDNDDTVEKIITYPYHKNIERLLNATCLADTDMSDLEMDILL